MKSPSQKMLLVSIDNDWCSKVRQHVSSIQNADLLPRETTLMAAYALVEEQQPDVVIIDDGYRDLPEFQMFGSLLRMLSIRALIAVETIQEKNFDLSRQERSDPHLKSIAKTTTPKRLVALIDAALQAATSALPPQSEQLNHARKEDDALLLIGASTGGVEALVKVLSTFPDHCVPTLIVQHTGQAFGNRLATLLDRVCPANVLKARARMPLERGTVYLAAGGTQHLILSQSDKRVAELVCGNKVEGHIPSVDVLFKSALSQARFCVAGVLTGMGKDGAEGLLALRGAGARTFAQDADSSVIYGMPKVAWDIGAVEHRVALKDIAQHVLKLTADIEKGDLNHGI